MGYGVDPCWTILHACRREFSIREASRLLRHQGRLALFWFCPAQSALFTYESNGLERTSLAPLILFRADFRYLIVDRRCFARWRGHVCYKNSSLRARTVVCTLQTPSHEWQAHGHVVTSRSKSRLHRDSVPDSVCGKVHTGSCAPSVPVSLTRTRLYAGQPEPQRAGPRVAAARPGQ